MLSQIIHEGVVLFEQVERLTVFPGQVFTFGCFPPICAIIHCLKIEAKAKTRAYMKMCGDMG